MAQTGRPRTTDNRSQLSAQISTALVNDVHATWTGSGRKRWEVIEDIIRLGLDAYRALPEFQQWEQTDFLEAS